IGGVETKRVYFGYYTAGGNVYEVQEVTTTQGQAYGNSGNINTTRVYYGSGAASQERGRLKTLIRDDATQRAYTYTKSGSNLVEVATEQNTVGSVVAGLSTRITTTTNDKGQVLNRQTDAYVGSTWYEAGKESYVYDSAGNVIERY